VIRPALAEGARHAIDETRQRVLIAVLVGDPFARRSPATVVTVGCAAGCEASACAPVAGSRVPRLTRPTTSTGSRRTFTIQLALRRRYRDEFARPSPTRSPICRAPARRAAPVLHRRPHDRSARRADRVDRATTARWVVAARSAVLVGTRDLLASSLGANTAEIESILRLVRSQLELSLRLLD
jgi:hypothetical protein